MLLHFHNSLAPKAVRHGVILWMLHAFSRKYRDERKWNRKWYGDRLRIGKNQIKFHNYGIDIEIQ